MPPAATRSVYDETGKARWGFEWEAHGCDDRHAATGPVGNYEPNGFELYDTLGNVWEWTQDCWHENYEGAPIDGSAWEKGGDCANRVVRGGSWIDGPENVRSASRNRDSTDEASLNLGFRLARDL